MQLEFPIEDLRKCKLMIGAPMYGGQCYGTFTKSMLDTARTFMHYGVPMVEYFLFNESLITRARNYISSAFMRSDCTHLLFVDSDIGFNPQDVLCLLGLAQQKDSPYDIIGAVYSKKCISFEKIKAAVDQGLADEDPNVLENFVGDFVFNPLDSGSINLAEPAEVLEIGTGFMMIRRETFEKFQEAFPQYMYRPDHVRSKDFDGSQKIMQFFQAEIDPKSERYLSEDYWFNQKAREIGLRTWICPWMKLTHTGSYIFGGSLADLARAGVSATADPSKLGRKK